MRGDITPSALGFTSMHDHTFVDLRVAGEFMQNMFPDVTKEMVEFKPENYGFLKTGTFLLCKELQVMDNMDLLVKEYGYFTAIGGKSVCDPAPIGARHDVKKLKELSEKTGINFICATGLYTETSRPAELLGKDEKFYYNLLKKEVTEGIEDTDIRPGVLKAALATYDTNGIADGEVAVLNACVRLTAETGISTHIHTDAVLGGDDIVNIIDSAVKRYIVDPSRILVCHMDNRIAGSVMVSEYLENPDVDRTLDLDVQKALLDRGYNIGLDTWGMPVVNPNYFMADDFERLKALITLIDLGYNDQITLGNDFASKLSCRTYGGYGCTRFADFGLAMLEQLGREDQAHKLVYENPARILAY